MRVPAAFAALIVASTALCLSAAQPPQCFKGRGVEGDRARLPEGWAAYTGGRGLIWTPLRQRNPQVIRGTENDRVSELEISDDGKWLLYVTVAIVPKGATPTERPGRLALVRRDGGGYTQFRPGGFDEADLSGGHCCGFFRNSPFADPKKGIYEIWYTCTPSTVRAAIVDLSGDKPVIGKDREIVRTTARGKDLSGSTNGDLGFAVSGGRMWGGRIMITIPQGGRGVATDDWIIPAYSGCGHAMSHDGDLVVQNHPADAGMTRELDRAAGAPEYIPQGHSGFMMGHFYEQPAPRQKIGDFYVTNGACIALAPVQEEEFHSYHFSNNKDYLICRKTTKGGNGANPSSYNGIWVIHWPSNTWTAIERDEKIKYWHPALYLEPSVGATGGKAAAVSAPAPKSTPIASAGGAGRIAASKPASAPARVVVKATLTVKNPPVRLQDMTYNHAYVVYEYQVAQVMEGKLAAKTIAVAHWHWRDRKMVTASDKTVGQTYTLTLEPFTGHPEFNDAQLGNQMPDVFIYHAEDSFADVAPVELQKP